MSTSSSNITLQPEVAEKFSATKDASRYCDGKWGMIDLNKIDKVKAESLVKEGFPYLKEKKKTNSSSN